jgi:5'(3')-deoxyribonucleotidase
MHFWANLPEMHARFKNLPCCVDLYNLCASVAPTYFLTAATAQSGRNSVNVVGGKIHWLKDRFGAGFSNYIVTERKAKALLAQPGRVLIDDHPKNVAEFTAAGGVGYLFTNELNLTELKAVIGAPL